MQERTIRLASALIAIQTIFSLLIAGIVGADLAEGPGPRVGANIGAPIILLLVLFQLAMSSAIFLLIRRFSAQPKD